jgi:TPR repeat protein
LAGLDVTGGSAPDRQETFEKQKFKAALKWIDKAARAGHFGAQAIMVSLYAAGLGPDDDIIEGAKWAHLYLTNPSRLNLGAPIAAFVSIDQIRESMDKTSWLIGKERARDWVPLYDKKKPPEPNK